MSLPPRDPDSPTPLKPVEGPVTNGDWFRVGRSSEQFGQRHTKTEYAQEKPAWATPPGFEILGELGRGGMSVVLKARQVALDRTVALKMIYDPAFHQPEALARFQAEARGIARVQHPNIVQIHEVGDLNGRPFLVLEYLDGGPLHRWLARTPPSPHQAAELLEPLARAVQHAHDQGVIHRDLKPSNILIWKDEGRRMKDENDQRQLGSSFILHPSSFQLKISDLGLANIVQFIDLESQTGIAVGTPQYLSPEQSLGQPDRVGPATDIYSLGAILYEMLTGRPPFEGGSIPETLLLLRTQEPVPPRRLRPRTPKDLETICLKCLEKDPARRYALAADLADDLRHFLNAEPIRARPVGPLLRALRWRRRNPRPAAFALLVLLLATVGPAAALWFAATALSDHRNADDAMALLSVARAEQHKSLRQQSDLSASAGLLVTGDPAPALRWFARAAILAHEAGDDERERANRIRLRNWERLRSLTSVRTVLFPAQSPVSVAVSLDGRHAIAAGLPTPGDALTETQVFDGATGQAAGPILHANGSILHAALAPGRPVAALAVNTTRPTAERLRTMFAPAPGSAVVQIWDWNKGIPLVPPLAMPAEPRAVAFRPDGSRLAIACAGGQIVLIETDAWTIVKSWNYPTPVQRSPGAPLVSGSVAFSPDGTYLLTWGLDDTLRVWDTATGRERCKLQQGDGSFTGSAFSPDGGTLATAHERGPVTVWNWATGVPARDVTPLGQTERASTVRFSPDGKLLLAALLDGTAKLWDWRTGKLTCPPLRHPAEVVDADFLLDPAWVVTTTADGTVRVWDRRDGRPIFVGSASPRCHGAAMALDRRSLVTGCAGGIVRIFDLGDLIVPSDLPTLPDPEAD